MVSAADYEKIKSLNKGAPDWKWIEANFELKPIEDIPLSAHIRREVSERVVAVLDAM